jgi:transcriptional regulator with XRE-family HTH domain
MAKKPLNPIDTHVGSRVRMRRMMLGVTQTTLGKALGVTFQQVQKNEKGTNRIGASRLQQLSRILQVPVSFFFDGAPHVPGQHKSNGATPSHVTACLASSDGFALIKVFMRIKEPGLRRRIVDLVEEIADEDDRPSKTSR